MIEAEKQNPGWWSNLRLARARGSYLSKAQWSQCYLSPRSRSQEAVRILARSGGAAQGSEGRRKCPGFSLFNSLTISQQCLTLDTFSWKTIDGEIWATQATAGKPPSDREQGRMEKGKKWIWEQWAQSLTVMEISLIQ